MFVDKQTHQLRYRQHRVGVIQVNGNLVRQVVIGFMQHVMATQDILHRGRHEEILLAQAQLAAGVGRVVRIEHAGDVFGVVFILYRGEVVAWLNLPRLISLLACALHRRSVLVASVSKPGMIWS